MDTLERPVDETSFIPFEVRPIPSDDPAIKVMRDKFYQNYGLTQDAMNPKLTWFGVFNKDVTMCLCVFAIGARPDGGVEGTDFYVYPSREGVKAAAWTLKTATQLIDADVAPFFCMFVLGRNHSMRRRVEEAFCVDAPRSVLYYYGKK